MHLVLGFIVPFFLAAVSAFAQEVPYAELGENAAQQLRIFELSPAEHLVQIPTAEGTRSYLQTTGWTGRLRVSPVEMGTSFLRKLLEQGLFRLSGKSIDPGSKADFDSIADWYAKVDGPTTLPPSLDAVRWWLDDSGTAIEVRVRNPSGSYTHLKGENASWTDFSQRHAGAMLPYMAGILASPEPQASWAWGVLLGVPYAAQKLTRTEPFRKFDRGIQKFPWRGARKVHGLVDNGIRIGLTTGLVVGSLYVCQTLLGAIK